MGCNSKKTDGFGGFEEPAEVGYLLKILKTASSSIDDGDYLSAIEDFGKVVTITQNIFGDNIELMELRRKIKEIEQQLKEIDRH